MEYLLLIATDETTLPQRGTAEFDAWMGAWTAFTTTLADGGHFIAGAGLQPTVTATTVAVGGTPGVTDGPFAETKEQIGGLYVIDAENLDEALALAAQVPVTGSVEVRPLSYRPFA